MRSPSQIRFNYRKALTQARKLDNIARDIRSASNNDMNSILQDLSSAWKSDSSQRYLSAGRTVGNNMKVTADNLNNIADAIREIAEEIRDAEMEAWRIAHDRD